MAIDNIVATLIEVGELMGIEVNAVPSKKMVYIGKGKVILRSAEKPDTIRGFAASDMWIDEASFIKNNDAYLRGFGRLSGSKDRQVYITSSPCGRDWVYKLAQAGNAELITQALIDNYFLDQKFFETLLSEYGGEDSDFARQELYGEIVTFDSGFFPVDRIEIVDAVANPMHTQVMSMAFDLAFTDKKNSDFSAASICGTLYSGDFGIFYGDEWKFKAPETKQKIKEVTDMVDCDALIETNSGGQVIYDDLIRSEEMKGKRLIPLFSSTSKAGCAMGLATAMNAGRVKMKKADWNGRMLEQFQDFNIDDSHEYDDLINTVWMNYNHLKHGHQVGFDANIL